MSKKEEERIMWKLIYVKVSAKLWKEARGLRKLSVPFSSVDLTDSGWTVLSSDSK